MDAATELMKIDYGYVFLSICAILLGVKFVSSLFEWVIEKLGLETKWMRREREDHELLIKTSKNLAELQKKHDKDENDLKECLMSFIDESRKADEEMRNRIKKIDQDNHCHWETSKDARSVINDTLKSITETNLTKDKQIDSLIVAQKEMLAEKINEKYKYYVSIKGIPEDEYEEFVSLHKAYNGVGGNHNGDAKFEYCINHLPIIPVETKLILKKE